MGLRCASLCDGSFIKIVSLNAHFNTENKTLLCFLDEETKNYC